MSNKLLFIAQSCNIGARDCATLITAGVPGEKP